MASDNSASTVAYDVPNVEPLRTVDWIAGKVRLIDQTVLPDKLVYIDYTDWRDVVDAISTMVVRGAPAIGCTAALGIALGAKGVIAENRTVFLERLQEIAEAFRASRPTAVNLFWAIDRIMQTAENADGNIVDLKTAILDEARLMLEEDIATNRLMGKYGADLLTDRCTVLTHCNAGALATVGYGTALGVIRAAVEAGKHVSVFVDETRPRLQGMKLTAWELARDGIDVTVIADNMAASLMLKGKIDVVVVGADRIAANGDTANKIGTYAAAVLAKHHRIPFYIAAPYSTIDFELKTGDLIPIEERNEREMTHIGEQRIMPKNVATINPAFDVTPADLITGIITEYGVIRPPYLENLKLSAPAEIHQIGTNSPLALSHG